MSIKGFPLSCFDKAAFGEDGLEFFVCNGGGGLAGVRKRGDSAHTIFVRDTDVALNLNMQAAKARCGRGRFAVSGFDGAFAFRCDGKEMDLRDRFQAASAPDWKRYAAYLRR